MLSFDKIKEILATYFQSQPILRAWIFGSYARGEENANSDIDILVDFEKNNSPSLLKHVDMIMELEQLLGRKIDLIPAEALYPSIKASADKEKILIYERA